MRKWILPLGFALMVSLDAFPSSDALGAPAAGLPQSVSASPSYVSGSQIVGTALRYLGYPYTTVGNSPSTGFSCIGFVSYVYNANGIPLPGDLGGALAYAPQISFSSLLPGDVLYFQDTVWPGLSHAAIYLGGGRFVHAEWYNRGVVTSSFTNDPVDGNYWMGKYLGANRPWAMAVAPAPAPEAPAPIRFQPRTSNVAQGAPRLLTGPRAQVVLAGVNVRMLPSLRGLIREVANGGTSVVVLKHYLQWYWVRLPNGSFGWVVGAGIGKSGGQGASWSARPRSSYRHVRRVNVARSSRGNQTSSAGVTVNVRTGPSIGHAIAAIMPPGASYRVLAHTGSWLKVELASGIQGFVYSPLLSSSQGNSSLGQSSSPSVAAPASTGQQASPVLTAGVRVHYRAGLHAPVLGLAAAGSHLRILGSSNGWLHVRLRSGVTGFVDGAYVRQ